MAFKKEHCCGTRAACHRTPRELGPWLGPAKWEKSSWCWNVSVELGVLGQRREGEKQSHRRGFA